jgi:hypothetical protein
MTLCLPLSVCIEGGRTYLGRSVACREFATEVVVRQLDLAAEVSRGHSNHDSGEGPNRDRKS